MTTSTHLAPALLDQLATDGYVVIPEVLSARRCDELVAGMNQAWEAHGLARYSDDMPGVRFINNSLLHSGDLEDVLLDPKILSAARAVIGDRVLLNLVNGRVPGPGAAGQPLHVLDRRRGAPFDKCNAIWCLSDFTVENGATRVLPGSHLDDTEALARMADPNEPHVDELIVEAPRGSVVFHNSHLIHSGRGNQSARDRDSIHAAYSIPELPTHYDWTTLPEEVAATLSEPMRDLLGLRQPALLVTG